MAVVRNTDGTFTVTAKGDKWRKCYNPEKCGHKGQHEDGYTICEEYASKTHNCQFREVRKRE